jgi:hypothetical protein
MIGSTSEPVRGHYPVIYDSSRPANNQSPAWEHFISYIPITFQDAVFCPPQNLNYQ